MRWETRCSEVVFYFKKKPDKKRTHWEGKSFESLRYFYDPSDARSKHHGRILFFIKQQLFMEKMCQSRCICITASRSPHQLSCRGVNTIKNTKYFINQHRSSSFTSSCSTLVFNPIKIRTKSNFFCSILFSLFNLQREVWIYIFNQKNGLFPRLSARPSLCCFID